MIISSEAIYWFLSGKKIDHRILVKLAKYKGHNISDSLRKNIANSLSGKHQQSETTKKSILDFLKVLTVGSNFFDELTTNDISSPIDLGDAESNMAYIESGYNQFFQSTKLEGSFICKEVNEIFKVLRNTLPNSSERISDAAAEKMLLDSDLLSALELNNSLSLDISNVGITHGIFNLNLLLYLFACLELGDGKNTETVFPYLFEEIFSDTIYSKNILRPAFCHYASFLKFLSKKNGEELSDAKLAKKLDIELRDYYHYKAGDRVIPIKKLNHILERAGTIYFCTNFWTNLIVKFATNEENTALLRSNFKRYPGYFKIAQSRHDIFVKQTESLNENRV